MWLTSSIANWTLWRFANLPEDTISNLWTSMMTLWAVNDAKYIPQRAAEIIGWTQKFITIESDRWNREIESVSTWGYALFDHMPFAFVNGIENEFFHIKEGIYAIYDECYGQWYRWEELQKVISKNVVEFLNIEIQRVSDSYNDLLQQKTDIKNWKIVGLEEIQEIENDLAILKEYGDRLFVQQNKFSDYLKLEPLKAVDQGKDNVADILNAKVT